MVDISRKTYEKNGVGTIVDSDGILWLNEKQIEEELDHKTLGEIAVEYHSDHTKHRYKLKNKIKQKTNNNNNNVRANENKVNLKEKICNIVCSVIGSNYIFMTISSQ